MRRGTGRAPKKNEEDTPTARKERINTKIDAPLRPYFQLDADNGADIEMEEQARLEELARIKEKMAALIRQMKEIGIYTDEDILRDPDADVRPDKGKKETDSPRDIPGFRQLGKEPAKLPEAKEEHPRKNNMHTEPAPRARRRSAQTKAQAREHAKAEADSEECTNETVQEKLAAPRRTIDVTETQDVNWETYSLKKEVLLGIRKMGFLWPSPIQAASIPYSLQNKNIIARAKNGTGKTAAYAIPLLNKLNPGKSRPQALVLAPTRELVLQIVKVVRELGQYLKIKVLPLYGGVSAKDDVIRFRGGSHIIVGTPGRIFDFIGQGVLDVRDCKYLVYDEADKLLSKDFQEVAYEITSAAKNRVSIELYSATFPCTIQSYMEAYMDFAVKINLMRELTLRGVRQYYAYVEAKDKLYCLKTLLEVLQLNQCFIFCNSIHAVELLAKRITDLGFTSYFIHSQMRQEERNVVFHNFTTKRQCRILVATDLVTRGIDVPSVNVVINFDLPRSTEGYLHRIGRSGRFGTEGTAVNMVTPGDVERLREIEKELGVDMIPFK